MTAYVMPKLVSGRVVKTRTGATAGAAVPSASVTAISNSAPSDRPIQLRCMILTRSGQSSASRSSSSWSA